MYYRRRSRPVEALQYLEKDIDELRKFLNDRILKTGGGALYLVDEGDKVNIGDYIVKDEGKFSVYSEEDFKKYFK